VASARRANAQGCCEKWLNASPYGVKPEAPFPMDGFPNRSSLKHGAVRFAVTALTSREMVSPKLFLTIAAAFAEAERDRIRERIGQVPVADTSAERFRSGSVAAKAASLIPHEAEQEAIREMVALCGQGKALMAIAEAIHARGHRISHEGVAGVLRGRLRCCIKRPRIGSDLTVRVA
jgi:hypothetical protein